MQSVNRSCQQNIATSSYLQLKMHFRHLSQKELSERATSSKASQQMQLHKINPAIYHLKETDPFVKVFTIDDEDGLPTANTRRVRVSLKGYLPDESTRSIGTIGDQDFVEGNRHHSVGESWRKMNLFLASYSVRIFVRVEIYGPPITPLPTVMKSYEDSVKLEAEDATINNLVKVFQEVQERTRIEHEQLAEMGYLARRPFGKARRVDVSGLSSRWKRRDREREQ